MGPFESEDPAAVAVRIPRPSRLREPLAAPYPKAADALEALGLHTVGDLLTHLPRERRESRQIADLQPGEQATIVAEVRSISTTTPRSRKLRVISKARVADASGELTATFFNQWLPKTYAPGSRVALQGKFDGKELKVSKHSRTEEVTASESGISVYAATEGISSLQIAELVRAHRGALGDVIDPLPGRLRASEGLADLASALHAMHFGTAEDGRRRLAFDELLLAQLTFERRRARRSRARALALDGSAPLTGRWLDEVLPFRPTADQASAMVEISTDLSHGTPMQRLLMGEVGSGKTVVALHAMLRAVEHGMQAALMAPTETLAEQHFATLQGLMPGELVPAALLTGSTPAARRADTLAKLSTGELPLVVGTHALIEPTVVFDRLAVAVVDEQHRFGVRQRAALDAKGPHGMQPHILHMTATPIPRTMRLLGWGDIDSTAIRELPGGRKPITTHIASTEPMRARAYERVREELRAGHQAFVVCPLVEESDVLEAKAATAEFERLRRTEFADFDVVLLHGQMRPRDKQAAMAHFAGGGADVLVATSVIEVGIDVPNATVMLVEDAERYGISQLHQLRGRIGRGGHASVCILLGRGDSKRLRAVEQHSDGFRLAEIDLELRQEGELVGTRQSGFGAFDVARLPDDVALLDRARAAATALVASDPNLEAPEHVLLADVLRDVHGEQALGEPIPA